MAASVVSDAPVQADQGKPPWAPLAVAIDVDLLHGLGALAELLGSASETLNQCLLTIEDTLNALSITQEAWVPIQTDRSFVERVPAEDGQQTSQQRLFAGVLVTILKLDEPASQQAGTPRCEREYQLGYSRVGDSWALMIRTTSFQPSNGDEGLCRFSDLTPLRDAPLEIRLKGIREIPSLIKLLDSRRSVMPGGPA